MLIYIDIDETICRSPADRNYREATPIEENIRKVNALFDEGHTIVFWTARGSKTGIDWRSVTEEQFEKWGVKYHTLEFGKPPFDLMIDDKVMNVKDWV